MLWRNKFDLILILIVLYADPDDVGGKTARPPCPTARPIHHKQHVITQSRENNGQLQLPLHHQRRRVRGDQPAPAGSQLGAHPRIQHTHALKHRCRQNRDLTPRINHKVNIHLQLPLHHQRRRVRGDLPAPSGSQLGAHPRIQHTHALKHRRRQNRDLTPRINHKVNIHLVCPSCEKPGCC